MTLKEDVEKASVTHFGINKVPTPVYEAFVSFCKRECEKVGLVGKPNYAIGLTKAMEIVAAVESVEVKEEENVKSIRTFGGD